MGCDIHWVLERKYDGGWLGIYSTDFTPRPAGSYHGEVAALEWDGNEQKLTVLNKNKETVILRGGWTMPHLKSRNYTFFGRLAGVRDDAYGTSPRGFPDDISDMARAATDHWDADGHSGSWGTLKEFVMAYLMSQDDNTKVADLVAERMTDEEAFLKRVTELTGVEFYEGEASIDEYRVVYWFDN